MRMLTLDTDQDDVDKIPLVSVCMTSYNSAAWLKRSVGSVLRQRVSFPFEVVIGDDRSTDETPSVLRALQEEHPELIRVLDRETKLGMQRNYFDTFEHCRGKYIAWLDADDYWTDPNKLSAQVAVLDGDTSISACGHFVRQVSSTGQVIRNRCPEMRSGRFSIADIVAKNFVPSPSIMFRNGIHRSLPEAFFTLSGLVDWPILLQSALAGDLVLLDEVMADYVLTPGSAYMSKGPLYQDAIDLEFYAMMRHMLPDTWDRAIRAAEGKRFEAMARQLMKLGKLAEAREAARQSLRVPDLIDNLVSKVKVSISIELLGRLARPRTQAPAG